MSAPSGKSFSRLSPKELGLCCQFVLQKLVKILHFDASLYDPYKGVKGNLKGEETIQLHGSRDNFTFLR